MGPDADMLGQTMFEDGKFTYEHFRLMLASVSLYVAAERMRLNKFDVWHWSFASSNGWQIERMAFCAKKENEKRPNYNVMFAERVQ